MNETTNGHEAGEGRNLGPVIGFAIGALVGGVVAVLMAPDSGERTRRRLKLAGRRLTRDARNAFEDARDTVGNAAGEMGADMSAAIRAGRDAFRHDDDGQTPAPASRIAIRRTAPPDKTP